MTRGRGSKYGDRGWSGDVWDCKAESGEGSSSTPPPSPPSYQFSKDEEDEEERVKREEVSAAIKFVTGNNGDGGGESLEKSWLAGRDGGRWETPDYG